MLSVGSIDPLARSVRANRIVVLLAEHHGLLEMGARAVTVVTISRIADCLLDFIIMQKSYAVYTT